MGYTLRAVVAKHSLFEAAAIDYTEARVIPLALGFALIPVTDELFDELTSRYSPSLPDPFPEFFWLSAAIASWCVQLSRDGVVAFLDADYAGGNGTQSAIVWGFGEIVTGPVYSSGLRRDGTGAIAQALRAFGVIAVAPLDEFDTVGLQKHRHIEDWIEEAEA